VLVSVSVSVSPISVLVSVLSHSRKLRNLVLRSVLAVIKMHLHLSLNSYILEYGILEMESVPNYLNSETNIILHHFC